MQARRLLWSTKNIIKQNKIINKNLIPLTSSINNVPNVDIFSNLQQQKRLYTHPAKEMDFLINDVYDMQSHWKNLEGQDEGIYIYIY